MTERAVESHAVIGDLNSGEDERSGFFAIEEDGLIKEFIFKSAPEGFHESIIVAVGFAAHAGLDASLVELSAIFGTGVLAAAIGMMQEALRRKRLTMFKSHLEGLEWQRGLEVFLHGPADDFTAVEVHDGREVEPSLPGRNEGNISDPDLIDATGGSSIREPVGSDRIIMTTVGGLDAEAAAPACYQSLLAHEPLDAFMVKTVTASVEYMGQPWAAVSSLELGKDALKECSLIAPLLLADVIGLPFEPGVIGAARQLQGAAELAHRIEWGEVFHSLATFGRSERIAIVFFKISHWVRMLCSSVLAARKSRWTWAGDWGSGLPAGESSLTQIWRERRQIPRSWATARAERWPLRYISTAASLNF